MKYFVQFALIGKQAALKQALKERYFPHGLFMYSPVRKMSELELICRYNRRRRFTGTIHAFGNYHGLENDAVSHGFHVVESGETKAV